MLGGKQPIGWDMLQGYAADPTATAFPGKQGVICSPADPQFDEKQLEEVAKATGTDPGDFAYPLDDGVEVRGAPRANAPVTEKLGMVLIRIMPDPKQAAPAQNEVPMVRVVTPSGKVGYISADVLSPLGNDQICYVKDASGWKITGYRRRWPRASSKPDSSARLRSRAAATGSAVRPAEQQVTSHHRASRHRGVLSVNVLNFATYLGQSFDQY